MLSRVSAWCCTAIHQNRACMWRSKTAGRAQLRFALLLNNHCSAFLSPMSGHTLLDISLFEGVDSGLLFNRERVHALCLYDSGERDPYAKQ